jgi:uncharacterized membrane protein YtjA (UPF0391 family)
MFRWGIIFLVIALIAAALGFGSLAGTAAWAAKIVFVVGIILFLVSSPAAGALSRPAFSRKL